MRVRSVLAVAACLLAPAGASALQVSGLVLEAPAGAKVSLLPLPSNHAWRLAVLAGRTAPEPAVTVDAGEGRFVLAAPSAGMWTVVVTSPGRVPMRYLPLPVTEPVELPPLELVPDAGVEIRVLWTDGKPAAGAWVLLTTGSPDLMRSLRADGWQVDSRIGRTDAKGRLKLPRVAGEVVKVHALARDSRRTAATVPAGVARTELILEPSAGSRVVEVRDASGAAVAGAAVSSGSPAWPVGVTDSGGRLTLPADGEGPFDLLLADGRRHKLESLPSAVALPALRRLEGRVLDGASGKPLAWALVWPGDDPGNLTFTGPGGAYSVPERAGGGWVQAEASGFQPASAKLPQGAGRIPALSLAPAGTLAGRVADKAGAPLGNVVVTVAPDRRGQGEVFRSDRAASRALSDADGRFVLRGLARGQRVNVLLEREGYVPFRVAEVETPAAQPLAVVLEPASRVRGRVEDASGRPVPGANVRLRPAPPPPGTVGVEPRRSENTADAEAGSDGTFAFTEVAPGAVTLEAAAEGFVPSQPVELRVPPNGEVRDVRLVLGRGAVVSGGITTTEGEPVAGAQVRIGAIQSESDAEGRYRLAGVPLGLKALALSHPAYKPKAQQVDVQPGENRADVTLERGAKVSGRVVDEAGAPRPGAEMAMRNRSEHGLRGYRASSGADGRFELLGVIDGSFDLEAEAEGFAPAVHPTAIEVAGRDVEGLEVVLRRGATLSGRIRGLEPGQSAAVEVTAERAGRPARPGTVDHAGRYEIAALEAGDWHVRARLAGGRREADAWVAVAPGDREVERDLKLGGGLALDGLVLLEDRPLPLARVSLRGLDVAAERGVTTDHQGAFGFEDLEPGRYRVEVTHAERMLSQSEDLEIAEDREVVIEIATATLSGTVVAAGSGEAVAGALVYLQRFLGAEPGPLTTVGTNAAGSFVTASLAPGRYRLTVRGNGYAPEERAVDVADGVPTEPLTIELDPTAGLALSVRRAAGEPPVWATVVALDEGGRPVHVEEPRLSDRGLGFLQQVPPGNWTLLIKAAGSASTIARSTVPGKRLEVTLPRGAALTVRVPALSESRTAAALTLAAADGTPYFGVNPGGFFQQSWPLAGGVATVADVPAGQWRLKVTAADGRVWSGSVNTNGEAAAALVIE